MRAIRLNDNSQVAGRKTKTVSWKMLKRSVELQGNAELNGNLPWSCHYKQPLSHYTKAFDPKLMYRYRLRQL